MDWQSAFGKVPSGIGKRCRERGIPVAAIVGGMGDKAETEIISIFVILFFPSFSISEALPVLKASETIRRPVLTKLWL